MSAPFTISRLLRAPRQLVWEVYTQPQHLPNWFGPKGCTMPQSTLDLRVGGTFHYCLQMPDGMQMWGKWHFKEITEPEKLVLVQHFSDTLGAVTHHPMAPGWPSYTLSTTTLKAQGNNTLLTLEWTPYEASAEEIALFDASHASMNQGWSGNLDVLEAYLSLLQTKA